MDLDVPQPIRDLIGDHDYADVVTYTTSDATKWTPSQWASAAFHDVAGRTGQLIWRILLGLRLHRRATAPQMAGWPIDGCGDNWIRLKAESWMLVGQLVIRIDGDRIWLTTALTYRRRIGERVWTRLAGIHAKAAPDILPQAHRVLRER